MNTEPTTLTNQRSADEWGQIARDAAKKAIECNKYAEWQFADRHFAIARFAARMERVMSRRIELTPAM